MAPGGLIVTRNVNNDEPYYPVSFPRDSWGTGSWRDLSRSLSTNNLCVGVVQGVVVNPEAEWVPDKVRRIRQPGRILVMFYGPAYNKVLHPLPSSLFYTAPLSDPLFKALYSHVSTENVDGFCLCAPFAVRT